MAHRQQHGRQARWRWAAALLCAPFCAGCIATGQIPASETLSEARQSGLAPGRRLDRQAAPLPTDCRLPWLLSEEESSTLNLQEGCKSEPGLRWFPRGGPRGIAWETNSGFAT